MIDFVKSRWCKMTFCFKAITVVSLILGSTGACIQPAATPRSGIWVLGDSAQITDVITLPSGYQLKLIKVGPVYSTTTKSVIAEMVEYQTHIPVTDVDALLREANGIFNYYRPIMERRGFTAIVLSAVEPADSTASSPAGYRFVWKQNESGTWLQTR